MHNDVDLTGARLAAVILRKAADRSVGGGVAAVGSTAYEWEERVNRWGALEGENAGIVRGVDRQRHIGVGRVPSVGAHIEESRAGHDYNGRARM